MSNVRKYKLYIDVVPTQNGPFGVPAVTGATINNNGLYYMVKKPDGSLGTALKKDFYINIPLYRTERNYEYVDFKIDDSTHTLVRQEFNPFFIEYDFFDGIKKNRADSGSDLTEGQIALIKNVRLDLVQTFFDPRNINARQISLIRERRPDISNGITRGSDLNTRNIDYIKEQYPSLINGIFQGSQLNDENIDYLRGLTGRSDINQGIRNSGDLTEGNIAYLREEFFTASTTSEEITTWFDENYSSTLAENVFENSSGRTSTVEEIKDWYDTTGKIILDRDLIFSSSTTSRRRSISEYRDWFDEIGIDEVDPVELFLSSDSSQKSTDDFVKSWFSSEGFNSLPWSDGTSISDILALSEGLGSIPDSSVREWYDTIGKFQFPWNEGNVNEVTRDDFESSSLNPEIIVSKASIYPIDINN